MKTKYDKLPSGLETNDRSTINRKMNQMSFTGGQLRILHHHYYAEENPWFKRTRYPFVDWLWDAFGVEERWNSPSEIET